MAGGSSRFPQRDEKLRMPPALIGLLLLLTVVLALVFVLAAQLVQTA
jgi:hypothetical protein